MFYPFEISTVHIVYAVLGGFIVLFGMFSLFLRERLYIGEAIWAFIFGVIIGPYCADIFNPRAFSNSTNPADIEETTNMITLEFTRVVLAIGVFAIGVELPKAYMRKHWKSLFFLLVPVMTWGWFISAAFIYALIPGLNFLSSLAVAACLTPTDPILAAAVVGGKWADKHVPAHIRHLLAAESGCNDGAAFPFLYLALYLTLDKSVGAAVRDWFLILWLYQVILGAIIGCFLGYGFRHLMKFCQRHDLIDRHSYVAQYVSLAMLTIGVTTLLGSDDLLAAFFCGTAFAWDGFFNKQTEESVFSSVIDTLFNVAAFIYVGAWMPFNKFQDAALTLSVWRLLVIAILVLLLRRLPVMMMLYKWIPDIKTFREAVFSGHFGPIGIGAVFISTLAIEVLHSALEVAKEGGHDAGWGDGYRAETEQMQLLENTIQPIVAFMVLCSITIHGLSIPSFSLGRRVHSVSRTWSRRDTMNSAGGGQPEWANQARRVTRAEDVVVNRDRDDGQCGVLRRGSKLGDEESGMQMGMVEKGSSGGTTSSTRGGEGDEEDMYVGDEEEKMAESGLTGDTRVANAANGVVLRDDATHVGFVDSPGPATRIGTPVGTRPGTPVSAVPAPILSHPAQRIVDLDVDRQQQQQQAPLRGREREHERQVPEFDRDNAPDGPTRGVQEWIEGNSRVIETKKGPGSDVEVVVINESPEHGPSTGIPTTRWQGKMQELEQDAEEIGRAITRELTHLSQLGGKAKEKIVGGVGSASASIKSGTGSVKGKSKERESVLFSKAKTREREREQLAARKQEEIKVLAPASTAGEHGAVEHFTDDDEDDADAWASDVENPLPTSGSSSTPTPATAPLAKLSRSSSRTKTHHHAHAHARHTSHPVGHRSPIPSSSSSQRPGTSDSMASVSSSVASLRNQRLENIRAGSFGSTSTSTVQSQSRPGSRPGTGTRSGTQTRDSSPSRNVRFVEPAVSPSSSNNIRPSSSGGMAPTPQQQQQQQQPPPSVAMGLGLGLGIATGAGLGVNPMVERESPVDENEREGGFGKRRRGKSADDLV